MRPRIGEQASLRYRLTLKNERFRRWQKGGDLAWKLRARVAEMLPVVGDRHCRSQNIA